MASVSDVSTSSKPTKCGKCQDNVGDVAFSIGNRLFHIDCFKCAKCDVGLTDQYVGPFSTPSCIGCYMRSVAPRCQECKQPITEEACYELCNRPFHKACLKCPGCNLPFEKLQCFTYNEVHYCLSCYWVQARKSSTDQ